MVLPIRNFTNFQWCGEQLKMSNEVQWKYINFGLRYWTFFFNNWIELAFLTVFDIMLQFQFFFLHFRFLSVPCGYLNPGRYMILFVDFSIRVFKIVTIESTKPLKFHSMIEIWKESFIQIWIWIKSGYHLVEMKFSKSPDEIRIKFWFNFSTFSFAPSHNSTTEILSSKILSFTHMCDGATEKNQIS